MFTELNLGPELLAAVNQAIPNLQDRYEKGAEIYAKREGDPEGEVDSDFVIVVRTSIDVDGALSRMEEFDRWWITNYPDLLGLVSFHVEYK